MYRFHVDDPDVIDVDRIETEWEDQVFDPGDRHPGETDPGIGREEGLNADEEGLVDRLLRNMR